MDKLISIIIGLFSVGIPTIQYFENKKEKTYRGNACVYSLISAEKCLAKMQLRIHIEYGIVFVLYILVVFGDIFGLYNGIKIEHNVIIIGFIGIMVISIIPTAIFRNYIVSKEINLFEKCISKGYISTKKVKEADAIYLIISGIIILSFVLLAYLVQKKYIHEWMILGAMAAIIGDTVFYSIAKAYFELRYICRAKSIEIKIAGMDNVISRIKEYQINNSTLFILRDDENGNIQELLVPREQIEYIKRTANINERVLDLVRANTKKEK